MYKKIVKEIYPYLTKDIVQALEKIDNKEMFNKIKEIRIRNGGKVILNLLSSQILLDLEINNIDILKILEKLSNYSIYCIQNELNSGYITINGGHRVGIAGTTVIENGQIKNVKEISSINIRIARQIIGCSDFLFKNIYKQEFDTTLIVSLPNLGKTTLIRDITRNISNKGSNTCIIDERGEIACMYNGIPQMDIGIRSDVINKCLKHIGIINAIRSMSPDVIVLDEIGSKEDIEAIKQCMLCGIKVLVTAHGNSMEDIQRGNILELIKLCIFKNILFISKSNKPMVIKDKYILRNNKYLKNEEEDLCIL